MAPWRLWYGLRSLLCSPWYRVYFALCGVPYGRGWRMYGRPTIHRCKGSSISAGGNLEIRSWPRANPVGISHPCVLTTLEPASFIRIGDDVGISGGCIAAAAGITIGNRVLIGADVRILDNDIHPLGPAGRRYAHDSVATAPIVIEDDVFLAASAIVLKGTTIGKGSIVGAGSIVTRDVPPYAIVAGNPARVIGQVPHV
jgi:acetyltransferase-like isoleucine patch superfamily enzyme